MIVGILDRNMVDKKYKQLKTDKTNCKIAGSHFVHRSSFNKGTPVNCNETSGSHVDSLPLKCIKNGNTESNFESGLLSSFRRSPSSFRRNAVSEESVEERVGLRAVLKTHITNEKLKQMDVM